MPACFFDDAAEAEDGKKSDDRRSETLFSQACQNLQRLDDSLVGPRDVGFHRLPFSDQLQNDALTRG